MTKKEILTILACQGWKVKMRSGDGLWYCFNNNDIPDISLEIKGEDLKTFKFSHVTKSGIIIETPWLSPITKANPFVTWLNKILKEVR